MREEFVVKDQNETEHLSYSYSRSYCEKYERFDWLRGG